MLIILSDLSVPSTFSMVYSIYVLYSRLLFMLLALCLRLLWLIYCTYGWVVYFVYIFCLLWLVYYLSLVCFVNVFYSLHRQRFLWFALFLSSMTCFVYVFYSLSALFILSALSTSFIACLLCLCLGCPLYLQRPFSIAHSLFAPRLFCLRLLFSMAGLLFVPRLLCLHLLWLALFVSFIAYLSDFYIVRLNQEHLRQVRS